MKRFWILLLVLSLLFVACQNDAQSPASEAAEQDTEAAADAAPQEDAETPAADSDKLVVGMEATYPPFNWTQLDDSNGAVAINGTQEFAGGYDVEIAKRVAEGLGKELVIEKMEWEGLEPALRSGIIDAIIAGMSPLESRKESIDFSDIYYQSEFVIVVLKDGPYADAKGINDFAGATITGQLNTSHYTVIDEMEGVNKDPAMSDFGAMRVALESGIIDAYVAERPEGLSITEVKPNFTYIVPEPNFSAPIEEVSVAVGLQKGSDLVEPINEVLKDISAQERDELMLNALNNQPGQE